jgi:protein TonB
MFEDSLFATNPRRLPQQRWAALLSFLLQAGLVTLLVAIPLFYTEALPLDLVRSVIEVPAPPPGRPPAPPSEQERRPATTSNLDESGRPIAVRFIPKSAARIVDQVAPTPVGPGNSVVGAPMGDGRPDGVIGSFLSATNRILPIPKPPVPARPVPVSNMNEGLLIHKVTPEYPPLARTARQQGTVELHAIIGRDGRIQQLQVISGPPLLVQAAAQAVEQWRYRPYILNGQPVEVETQITVNFRLGG